MKLPMFLRRFFDDDTIDELLQKAVNITTKAFVEQMIEAGISRGYVVYRNGEVQISNQELKPIADAISNLPDYLKHEGVFFEVDKATKAIFLAVVHRTNRGAGQGGTRMKTYDTIGDLFIDGLRLAKGMTDKNACAEIWWGGGKSIIVPPRPVKDIEGTIRFDIFKNFGKFIASLNGLYVCAEDMNVSPEDLRIVHMYNRFCTCVPTEIGGSSNPSFATAKGVFKGMVAGLHFLEGKNNSSKVNLKGKHIIIQGAGNVGFSVLEQVVAAGGKVTVFDLRDSTKDKIRKAFTEDQVTIHEDADTLYEIEADVFSPNAIGAIINDETIPKLKVKMIAGAANNQLKNATTHAEALHKKGILYLPDFIINRMGIVNCANEQYGYLASSIEDDLNKIYPFTYNLLKQAKKDDISPQFKAMELAEDLSKINHPIWGHRGIKIIDQLMKQDWANSKIEDPIDETNNKVIFKD